MVRCGRLIILLSLAALTSVSCGHRDRNRATVLLQTPTNSSLGDPARLNLPPSGRLQCYGVSVSGVGLASSPATCAPAKGITGGFVTGGQALSIDVPRGDNRRIDLYLYLGLEGETTCPSWNAAFESNPVSNFGRTYLVSSLSGVAINQDVVSVTMQASFPGLNNSVGTSLKTAGSCTATTSGALVSMLYSNGDVRSASGYAFVSDLSGPTLQSILKTAPEQSLGSFLGVSSHGGILKWAGSETQVGPMIHSVTRKPDGDGSFYGLLADGQVVKVDSATGAPILLTSVTCPFETCQVPVWMESISAGINKDLYGKDHGGQIYRINSDGSVTVQAALVPEYVSHFVFF